MIHAACNESKKLQASLAKFSMKKNSNKVWYITLLNLMGWKLIKILVHKLPELFEIKTNLQECSVDQKPYLEATYLPFREKVVEGPYS